MQAAWRRLLSARLPKDLLEKQRFAVFGLGDSGYINYNVVAKKLFRRLQQLGAQPVLDLGLGDDQVWPSNTCSMV
jgi:sulfite reductase alpha subunit-like flavoprotein